MTDAYRQALAEIGPPPVEMPNFWQWINGDSTPEEIATRDALHDRWLETESGQQWREWDRRVTPSCLKRSGRDDRALSRMGAHADLVRGHDVLRVSLARGAIGGGVILSGGLL